LNFASPCRFRLFSIVGFISKISFPFRLQFHFILLASFSCLATAASKTESSIGPADSADFDGVRRVRPLAGSVTTRDGDGRCGAFKISGQFSKAISKIAHREGSQNSERRIIDYPIPLNSRGD
jgi:hypothetical protein